MSKEKRSKSSYVEMKEDIYNHPCRYFFEMLLNKYQFKLSFYNAKDRLLDGLLLFEPLINGAEWLLGLVGRFIVATLISILSLMIYGGLFIVSPILHLYQCLNISRHVRGQLMEEYEALGKFTNKKLEE